MLTPDELDEIPNSLANLFDDLEKWILEKMAVHLKDVKIDRDHLAWALKENDVLRLELAKKVKVFNKTAAEEWDETVYEALKKSIEQDYKMAGKEWDGTIGESARQKLRATLKTTKKDFSRLTKSTCDGACKEFLSECNNAYMKVHSGAFDYQEAISEACDNLAKNGISRVYYHNSKPIARTIEAAVRADVLTSVNHLCSQVTLDNCDDLGCDLVEVSAHEGARPEHEAWQGKIYSRSGKSDKYPPFSICDYGSATGLCGINCRHSFYPYIEGRRAQYTKDELKKMEGGKKYKYNGKDYTRYEASQVQRGLERKIRYYKKAAGIAKAGGSDRVTFYNGKVKEWQARRESFTKETGLAMDRARERVGKWERAMDGFNEQNKDNNNIKKMLDSLTDVCKNQITKSEHIDSIKTYTGSDYRCINKYLREGVLTTGAKINIEDTAKNIHEALSGCELPPMYVKRVASGGYIDKLCGSDVWRTDPKSLLEHKILEDKGFLSTTLSKHCNLENDVTIYYKVPNKARGAYIESISKFSGEYETLFINGTRMHIKEVTESRGHIIIMANML